MKAKVTQTILFQLELQGHLPNNPLLKKTLQ
jgi:hypothetical protein